METAKFPIANAAVPATGHDLRHTQRVHRHAHGVHGEPGLRVQDHCGQCVRRPQLPSADHAAVAAAHEVQAVRRDAQAPNRAACDEVRRSCRRPKRFVGGVGVVGPAAQIPSCNAVLGADEQPLAVRRNGHDVRSNPTSKGGHGTACIVLAQVVNLHAVRATSRKPHPAAQDRQARCIAQVLDGQAKDDLFGRQADQINGLLAILNDALCQHVHPIVKHLDGLHTDEKKGCVEGLVLARLDVPEAHEAVGVRAEEERGVVEQLRVRDVARRLFCQER
mmetsp:Transcript_92685/g.299839  ORF Transcript_92685/g.299839 Transcript_92685/m.299839 type:complete len:277 (-) Transcript_92685:1332-2162(-)